MTINFLGAKRPAPRVDPVVAPVVTLRGEKEFQKETREKACITFSPPSNKRLAGTTCSCEKCCRLVHLPLSPAPASCNRGNILQEGRKADSPAWPVQSSDASDRLFLILRNSLKEVKGKVVVQLFLFATLFCLLGTTSYSLH